MPSSFSFPVAEAFAERYHAPKHEARAHLGVGFANSCDPLGALPRRTASPKTFDIHFLDVAIYHLSVKPICRSAGRSATAAAAYRAGELIEDLRTGEVFNYTRRGGVERVELVMPDGATWRPSRAELWNAAEAAERRKDACVAREHEIAIPAELNADQRLLLVTQYCQSLADRHGCAVDFAIHRPDKTGDQRNWHAHILMSTRKVAGEGFGQKCDREKAGRDRKADLQEERAIWEHAANLALHAASSAERIDRRSLAEQGINRMPSRHLGPGACGYERRTGQASRRRVDMVNEWRRAWQDRGQRRRSAPRNLAMALDVTASASGRKKVYRWGGTGASAGWAAVVQRDRQLSAAGRYTARKIAAMAHVAKQNGWKRIRLTGTDEFKTIALKELMARGLEVSNPELQAQVAAWRAANQAQVVRKQTEKSSGSGKRSAGNAVAPTNPWAVRLRDFFFGPPLKTAPKPRDKVKPKPKATQLPAASHVPVTPPPAVRKATPVQRGAQEVAPIQKPPISPVDPAASVARKTAVDAKDLAEEILTKLGGDRRAALQAACRSEALQRALPHLAQTADKLALTMLSNVDGDVSVALNAARHSPALAPALAELERLEKLLKRSDRKLDPEQKEDIQKGPRGPGMKL